MKAFDSARWQQLSPHLDLVLDLPPDERGARIDAIRLTDPALAADLEALLKEHQRLTARKFLDVTAPRPPIEPPLAGVRVGAYTLTSPIGHGGMGSVWLASRSDGRFEGHAAIKLLNAALIGRAVEERFTREGTILARLTHPHIAHLIDAGVTGAGQPYLVLEYIHGRAIDRFCDEERLDVDERIRLFLDVQSAVAHAHASLIVHRDLKPSNVLVTIDGSVKLLDFGIAKLLEDQAEDHTRTSLTRDGEMAMTPKYAAPEQVTGGAITTATDVYALGVLLFELLSGQHPTGLDARSPAEFARAIAEVEPLRLSSAAHPAIDGIAERAAARDTTPERLYRKLHGDLDTILAKALKANPRERYGSVAEFADDLRRFLSNQPISARPDSFGYRSAKFARRHRRVLSLAAAAIIAIVGMTVFYTRRIATERDRATIQAAKALRVSEVLTGLLTAPDPYRTPDGSEPTVQSLLELGAERVTSELAQEPDVQARLLTVIGRTYQRLGLHAKAHPLLERALDIARRSLGADHLVTAQSLNDLGVLNREQGNLAGAEPLLRESLDIRRRQLGTDDNAVAITLVELGRVLQEAGRIGEAEPLVREALAIRRRLYGDEHRETATSKSELGLLLLRRGDVADAEPLLRENVTTTEHLLGSGHPNTASAKSSLASALMARGDLHAAEALLREAVSVNRQVFGPGGAPYAQSLSILANVVELEGRLSEAERLLEDSLRIATPLFSRDHPRILNYTTSLAHVRIARGDAAVTEPALRYVLEARIRLYPAGDWRIGQAQSLLAAALAAQKRFDEAEPLMLEADRTLKAVPGVQGRERDENRARLAALYAKTGRTLAGGDQH